jgi:hypothetical protein
MAITWVWTIPKASHPGGNKTSWEIKCPLPLAAQRLVGSVVSPSVVTSIFRIAALPDSSAQVLPRPRQFPPEVPDLLFGGSFGGEFEFLH